MIIIYISIGVRFVRDPRPDKSLIKIVPSRYFNLLMIIKNALTAGGDK